MNTLPYKETQKYYSILSPTKYFMVCKCKGCNEWFIVRGQDGEVAEQPRFCEDCYEKRWIDIILDRI